jgi:sec-independent protein translocase protein TatB
MLDIGWSELLVVAVIALIVVGPRELPGLLRTVGRFVNTIRRQANDFRAQFDEAIKDSEFEEVRKEFQELRSDAEATVRNAGREIEDEMRDLDDVSRDIDRELKGGVKSTPAVDSKAASGEAVEGQVEHDLSWLDDHNKAILEAEEKARANGSTSVDEIDDPGAADDVAEVALREEAAGARQGANEPAPKAGANS